MNILLVVGVVVCITLCLFSLTRVFRVSIKYALFISFVIVAFLGFCMCYTIANFDVPLIVVASVFSVAVIACLLHLITNEIIRPTNDITKSINNFSDCEFGIDTHETKSGNEIINLQNSILNLTYKFKSIMFEVQENIQIVKKCNEQIFNHSNKLIQMQTTVKDSEKNSSENKASNAELICNAEKGKPVTFNNQMLYQSLYIN